MDSTLQLTATAHILPASILHCRASGLCCAISCPLPPRKFSYKTNLHTASLGKKSTGAHKFSSLQCLAHTGPDTLQESRIPGQSRQTAWHCVALFYTGGSFHVCGRSKCSWVMCMLWWGRQGKVRDGKRETGERGSTQGRGSNRASGIL